ncbi:hypothetical protein ACFL6O_01505 [candidate division KSB1 bacterium]
MKKIIPLLILSLIQFSQLHAQNLKPYIIAGTEQGSINEAVEKTAGLLESSGFTIAGKYSPMEDEDRVVICITHDMLMDAVRSTSDHRMFASVLRIGIHNRDGINEITYLNPLYWGNAYYQKDFPDVSDSYVRINEMLISAFQTLSSVKNEQFGSKKGKSGKDLRGYRYKIMMPHFDDVDELIKKSDFDTILETIDRNFIENSDIFEKVYDVRMPGKKLALIGVALKGEKGEKKFIPKIDTEEPNYLPFAPYELLVMEDKAIALRGRYRIAISFPDLSMGRFLKIKSAPGDIKNYLKMLVGNK